MKRVAVGLAVLTSLAMASARGAPPRPRVYGGGNSDRFLVCRPTIVVDVCEPGFPAPEGSEEPMVILCSPAIAVRPAGVEIDTASAHSGDEQGARGVWRTIAVHSIPDGAPIRMSVADHTGAQHGQTDFIRTYERGGAVELVAPPQHKGKPFLRWRIDGIDQFDGVTSAAVTLDYGPSAHTAIALYQRPAAATFVYVRAVAQGSRVELSWRASPDSVIAGYRVWRSRAGQTPAAPATLNADPLPPEQVSFRDTTATVGCYRYRLAAMVPGADEVQSHVVEVRVARPLPVLKPNFPDPFTTSTVLSYTLPVDAASVDVVIFDVAGRRVRSLMSGPARAGGYQLRWDGTDERGGAVSSGVYFCRLRAGETALSEKLALVK